MQCTPSTTWIIAQCECLVYTDEPNDPRPRHCSSFVFLAIMIQTRKNRLYVKFIKVLHQMKHMRLFEHSVFQDQSISVSLGPISVANWQMSTITYRSKCCNRVKTCTWHQLCPKFSCYLNLLIFKCSWCRVLCHFWGQSYCSNQGQSL